MGIVITAVEFIWLVGGDDDDALPVMFEPVALITLLTKGVTAAEAVKLTNPAIVALNKQFPTEIE